jgi:hypothetical protein
MSLLLLLKSGTAPLPTPSGGDELGWGIGAWGTSPWGGDLPEGLGVGAGSPPIIVLRDPVSGAADVPENATVSVGFFDADYDLDPGTIAISADGNTVYTGAGGFTAGFVGTTSYSAGRFVVQFLKIGGWGYDTEVTIRGVAEDLASNTTDDTWRWRTRVDPVCYTGLNPLPVETLIQSPMTQFLNLELARQTFLNNALQVQERAISNAGNKAARVMYQTAFSTEISVVQNASRIKNAAALATVVCEKQRLLVLDSQLQKFDKITRTGIAALFSQGALPSEYISAFNDYLDSTLYSYRVSLIANVVILARLAETA